MRVYADNIEITGYIGDLNWQNTIDELATTMSFEVAKTDAKHISLYTPQLGSIISLYANAEIFRGIVITIDDGDKNVNKYAVCDFGWYLNKSKETYQFNLMPASKVITKICADFNISIDTLPKLETKITKIYFDLAVSEIIWDVLELCGGSFNFDVTPKGLRVYRLGNIKVQPTSKVHPNMNKVYSGVYYSAKSHNMSIEDMKNSIKVISEKDDMYSVKTVAKNQDLIKKYGLLQDVVKVDVNKENPYTVATQKLQELSKVKEQFSIEITELQDSYTRAGVVILLENVDYIIECSNHSIKNGIHYVKLNLRKFR